MIVLCLLLIYFGFFRGIGHQALGAGKKMRRPRAGALLIPIDIVLENFLDIESVTATLPVILGMGRAVTLDPDTRPR
jgi:hypothetical protein